MKIITDTQKYRELEEEDKEWLDSLDMTPEQREHMENMCVMARLASQLSRKQILHVTHAMHFVSHMERLGNMVRPCARVPQEKKRELCRRKQTHVSPRFNQVAAALITTEIIVSTTREMSAWPELGMRLEEGEFRRVVEKRIERRIHDYSRQAQKRELAKMEAIFEWCLQGVRVQQRRLIQKERGAMLSNIKPKQPRPHLPLHSCDTM